MFVNRHPDDLHPQKHLRDNIKSRKVKAVSACARKAHRGVRYSSIHAQDSFPQADFSSAARDAFVQMDVISTSIRYYFRSAAVKVKALLALPAA